MIEFMRCFLALVPDGNGLEQLETITRPLRQWDLPARWQHTEDYHLTLCFLGQCDSNELHAIRYCIDEIAGSPGGATGALNGLGAFGGKPIPKPCLRGFRIPSSAALIIIIISAKRSRCALRRISSRILVCADPRVRVNVCRGIGRI